MPTLLVTSEPGRRAAVAAGLAVLVAAIVLATGPVATAQAPVPRSPVDCGTHDQTRRALHVLTDRDGITVAAVLVADPTADARCGRWTGTAGTADLHTGRPMNATDRLRAGSVTKTFTATLVLQLVAEHRLSLGDPVDRYLPGLIHGRGHVGGYDGSRITVRQLLQHTSGLPDYLDAPEWEHPEQLRYHHFEPLDLVTRALELPRPHGTWHYATTNYLVLGVIVREVTGRPPEAEVTRRIIEPLGLRDSYGPGDDIHVQGPYSRSYFTADDGALIAVGPGGRRVAVALNEVPASLRAELDFLDLVDKSLCEGRSSERTPKRVAPPTLLQVRPPAV
ncbi:serine hydrolase domain-containing protein [Streptomyces sp. NBC_00443]|uniref:serine hydrolase domain-containing protein n=1 Tax=Streptomyces sp. NBC_00443 TaxID=2975743 RepID=UPI002E223789